MLSDDLACAACHGFESTTEEPVSDPNDNSIPVLHEILVPGKQSDARPASHSAGVAADPFALREPGFTSEPTLAPLEGRHPREPVFAPEPSQRAEPVLETQSFSPAPREPQRSYAYDDPLIPQLNDRFHAPERQPVQEPVHEPLQEPLNEPEAAGTPDAGVFNRTEPVPPVEAGAALPPDSLPFREPEAAHHAPLSASLPASFSAPLPETADPGVFDRAEPVTPIEAGATVPPDIAHETGADRQARIDADLIAERLRGRFAGFLTGEGRQIVEARCRDALHEHTSALVSQITREVALTLETEMTRWVREAVEEEIARRG
jgi:hypothetical protein